MTEEMLLEFYGMEQKVFKNDNNAVRIVKREKPIKPNKKVNSHGIKQF